MSLVFQKILVGYNFNERYTSQHNMNHLKTWEEYKNLCLEKMIDGDDLYMIVWNTETNEPKQVRYGSLSVKSFSRFASYEDATPDIIALYEKWQNDQINKKIKNYRDKEANKLLYLRRVEQNNVVKYNLNIKSMRFVYEKIGYDLYLQIQLYLSKNFRNQFKKELKNRILRYLRSEINSLSFREIQLIKGERLV